MTYSCEGGTCVITAWYAEPCALSFVLNPSRTTKEIAEREVI
jgi:hypothetical protein